MKDSNENIITEEEFTKDIGHGTSQQPEEWSVRFDEEFLKYISPDGASFGWKEHKIKEFIQTEIRKAEERILNKVMEDLQHDNGCEIRISGDLDMCDCYIPFTKVYELIK